MRTHALLSWKPSDTVDGFEQAMPQGPSKWIRWCTCTNTRILLYNSSSLSFSNLNFYRIYSPSISGFKPRPNVEVNSLLHSWRCNWLFGLPFGLLHLVPKSITFLLGYRHFRWNQIVVLLLHILVLRVGWHPTVACELLLLCFFKWSKSLPHLHCVQCQ